MRAREVDKILGELTGPATQKQLRLGAQADLTIPSDMPRIVAAAAEELGLPAPGPVGDWSKTLLQILQRTSAPSISPQTEEEADAWIEYLRLLQRREHLSELELHEGDVVETSAGEVAQVSSIGHVGRVYFKGGRGFAAWPDEIRSVVARKDEECESATHARKQAENSAARRRATSAWSLAKSEDLSQFATDNFVSEDNVTALETVIANAEDERPIQKFLEDNGHLLTALLGGRERYCLSQKRLGAKYVTDFIIGDVDSLGVRWVFIELETPKSGIYLKNGTALDAKARKGVEQVVSWKNWLSNNIAYARQPNSAGGLGLFDIREKTDAIVLVGRRSRLPETDDAQRHEYRQSSNIQIHSYDWLLERLRGAIRHQGPPASNPYLIQNGA